MTYNWTDHSPPEVGRPEQELERWRNQLYRWVLVGASLVAAPHLFILSSQRAHQDGTLWPAYAGAAMLLIGLVAGLARGLSARTRLWIGLPLLYGASLLSLVLDGLSGGGIAGLFSLVTFSIVSLPARGQRLVVLIAVATLGCVAFAHSYGWLTVDTSLYFEPSNPWNWVRVASFHAATLASAVLAVATLMRKLVGLLRHRTQLLQELQAEAEERARAKSALDDAQAQLATIHQLEAVGRLAGGVAHDFNNTLTVILSYADLLKSRSKADPATAELAEQIIQAAEQGADLSKQLLAFARRQMVKPRNLEARTELQKVRRTLKRLIPSDIRVEVRGLEEPHYVRADPTQLNQAILNLAINARDAMPGGGELVLELADTHVEKGQVEGLMAGAYLAIAVRDTGTGMSDATMQRIFEPFYTTKEPGLGTGLGLSNVREMARSLGGEVHVESQLGEGTVFRLFLPRAEGHPSGVESRLGGHRTGTRSVLVVDDEPQVREVLSAILVDGGYDVHVAANAREALAIMREHTIHLACVDLVMPEMTGSELIRLLRELEPTLPVLVCSAFGTDQRVAAAVQQGDLAMLAKPFSRHELLEAVDRELRKEQREDPGSDTTPQAERDHESAAGPPRPALGR